MDTFGRFVTILENVAGIDPTSIAPGALLLDDLDLDSLTMVEILVVVEDAFGVHISDKELSDMRTVADAVAQIDQAAAAA